MTPFTRAITSSLLTAVLGCPVMALAWGNEGHRVVARIAETQLTKASDERLRSIFGGDVSLADVATCPDEVRAVERDPENELSPECQAVFPRPPANTEKWHYVDLSIKIVDPTDQQILAACPDDSHGPEGKDCVVTAIRKFARVLRDPAATRGERAQAVTFLVHFVGDVHQPLHAAEREGDHGGNLVFVSLLGSEHEKLHSVWDNDIVRSISGNEQRLATKLASSVQEALAEPPAGDINVAVMKWVRESQKGAREVAYKGVVEQGDSNLDSDYLKNARAIVRRRLAQAGVRLAVLLNELLK